MADIFVVECHEKLCSLHGTVWISGIDRVPEPMDQLEFFGFTCITEIAIKTNAVKSGRENMLKEQAYEVSALDGQRFLAVCISIVFVTESDSVFIDRDDTAV